MFFAFSLNVWAHKYHKRSKTSSASNTFPYQLFLSAMYAVIWTCNTYERAIKTMQIFWHLKYAVILHQTIIQTDGVYMVQISLRHVDGVYSVHMSLRHVFNKKLKGPQTFSLFISILYLFHLKKHSIFNFDKHTIESDFLVLYWIFDDFVGLYLCEGVIRWNRLVKKSCLFCFWLSFCHILSGRVRSNFWNKCEKP